MAPSTTAVTRPATSNREGVRLDISWEVEEVGWWIMSRAHPSDADRYSLYGVFGVWTARRWAEFLEKLQRYFRTEGLVELRPQAFWHPAEGGWRLIEELAPLGFDPPGVSDSGIRDLAKLTDYTLEPTVALLSALMKFIQYVPAHKALSATDDAVCCIVDALKSRQRKLESTPDN